MMSFFVLQSLSKMKNLETSSFVDLQKLFEIKYRLFFYNIMFFYNNFNKTWLQTLFWEIKSRFFYILLSFLATFIVAYNNSISLLYLFVSSYDIKSKTFDFLQIFTKQSSANQCKSSICKRFALVLDLFKEEKIFFIDNKVFSFDSCFISEKSSLNFTEISDQDLETYYDIINNICLNSITFIFTDVEEAFSSSILICFIFSFIVIFPYCFYCALAFFNPSLFLHESKKIVLQMVNFLLLWFCFIVYLQNKIIPKLAEFLLKFEISSSGFNLEACPKIYSYCIWASTIFIIANIIFLFLFSIILSIINKKINIYYFIERRKLCRVFLFLLAALFAPPDLFAQIFLTFIVIICLELAIYIFFIYKNITI